MGFVDIHSHILYGLDDGSKTRADSVAMLAMAAENSTTTIVATPHANAQYRYEPDLVERRIADLSRTTELTILSGCDFHLQADNIADAIAHPDKYTINHNGYLLVEFPDTAIFPNTDDILAQLIDAGMLPIITHPERHLELRNRTDDLAKWVQAGCLVQVTAGSFTGVFGKSVRTAAVELMNHGLVHIVASDAHDLKFRTTNLQTAYDLLADRWGEEDIRPLFVENPEAVVAGRAVEYELAPAPVRPRRWYHLWS